MQRHQRQHSVRFPSRIERDVPADNLIHVVFHTDWTKSIRATHKRPKVRTCLDRDHRWTFHSTQTSSPRLNTEEGSLAKLIWRHIKRGESRSLVNLHVAITRCLPTHDQASKAFVPPPKPATLVTKTRRAQQPSEIIRPIHRHWQLY